MSRVLLERVRQHIVTTGGLLGAYTVRYYRWSDKDLSGAASVALFRMSGTGGGANHEVQKPDVSLFLLASPSLVKQADDDMLSVLQYLRSDYAGTSVFAYHPLQGYTGPAYLENGRAMFEMVIRCGVEDH
ncbi:MAG: hypothetical protein OEZ19_00060 [Paracoccaceae bacterium]|nr:hypothetical protein [Paracoccaceae bacterium]